MHICLGVSDSAPLQSYKCKISMNKKYISVPLCFSVLKSSYRSSQSFLFHYAVVQQNYENNMMIKQEQ